MTTTSNFFGMPENAKPSSRVLKPPGGGSSILFDEPDGFHYRGNKSAAVNGKTDSAPKCDSGVSSGANSPIPPESGKNGNESSASSEAGASPPVSPQVKTVEEKVAPAEPFPDISKVKISDTNGNEASKVVNGQSTEVKKTETPEVKTPSTESTPTTPTTNGSPPRKVKDHMKSRIFPQEDAPEYSYTYKKSTPEVVKADQPTPQRQRVPPGGYSSKLW